MSCNCGGVWCAECNDDYLSVVSRIMWCNEACPTDKINPNPDKCTLCDKCAENNMFYVPKAPGHGYRCILDEMTFCQLQKILASNPCAKDHLLKITSDPCALQIAAQTDLKVPVQEQDLALQRRLMKNSIPAYTLFKGSDMGKNVK